MGWSALNIAGILSEIAMESRRFARYLLELHSMSQKTRHEIIDGKEADEVLKEVLLWILEDKAPQMQELRGQVQEVLTVRQLFNPILFVMHDCVLCYNKHRIQLNQIIHFG